MANDDTALKGSAVATPPANATGGNASTTGSESPQPAKKAEVDSTSTEDKGNSAASDGQDGADEGDGVRQRPGRAERKISELTSKIKELEGQLNQRPDLASQLLKTPVDNVQLPDYSQMTEITPDQIKKDIISAASQIVDIKMQTTANVLEHNLTATQAREKTAQALESAIKKYPALNPESEDYDAELDKELSTSYAEILQKDPTYTFDKFIKPMEKLLSNTTVAKETSTRGTSANRSTSASRRSANEFPSGGTTEEMEAWFARNRNA